MKNLFFILIAMSFIFTSCESDIFDNKRSSKDGELEMRRKGASSGDRALERVQRVSRWLRFESQEHYDLVYNYLEQVRLSPENNEIQRILREDTGDGYGTTYDPHPLIHDIELVFGILTLRKDILLQEDYLLRKGEKPDALDNIQNNGITTTAAQTLHSSDYVIQIGDKIIKKDSESSTIIVNDNNVELMNNIIDNGTEVIYDEENTKFVDLQVRKVKGFRSDFPCTGAFGVISGGNEDPTNKTAIKTFLWNQGDASGAKNLSLVWDFGDGNTTTTSSPQVHHQYENLQAGPATNTFNVCVTATYTIEKEEGDENCSQSTCQEVLITLDELPSNEDENLCDELTYAATAGGLLESATNGTELWANINPTPGNATEVCAVPSNELMSLIAALTESQVGFAWTFQNQSAEGYSACFEAGCDGQFQYSLQVIFNQGTDEEEMCTAFNGYYDHDVDHNCSGSEDICKGWTTELYTDNGNSLKLRWRAKHETDRDDGIFSSAPNQVEAEMKNYIFNVQQNKWKDASFGSTIFFDGNVYPQGNACDCGGIADMMDSEYSTNGVHVHHFERNQQMFPGEEGGIYCMVNDPYFVSFQADWQGTPIFNHSVSFPND